MVEHYNERGMIASGKSSSMLQPQFANIDKEGISKRSAVSHRSMVSEHDILSQGMVAAGIATNIPVTPATMNTVSTITANPGEQFNAFRVDEESSLESYKQTMEYKLKDNVFRKLKFITNDAMMEFSMDRLFTLSVYLL